MRMIMVVVVGGGYHEDDYCYPLVVVVFSPILQLQAIELIADRFVPHTLVLARLPLAPITRASFLGNDVEGIRPCSLVRLDLPTLPYVHSVTHVLQDLEKSLA